MRAIVGSNEDLGRLVASLRLRNKLSQEELARLLGVSQRYISELERGKPKILDARIFRVLRMLEIQLEAVLPESSGESDSSGAGTSTSHITPA